MLSLDYKTQRYVILFLFLIVPLTLLLTFTYYPAIQLFHLSFISWDGGVGKKAWVGLSNYKELFSNGELFTVFQHNLAYFIIALAGNVISLYFAIVLNSKLRGRSLFKLVLFLPYIINGVATAYMFTFIFDSQYGALNTILNYIGLGTLTHQWLGEPDLVNYSLASVNIWRFTGFTMTIYLAGLQAIPNDLYEAAKIDGASSFQEFRFITVPNLVKIIELNVFFNLVGSLEVFDLPYVLTKEGPIGASATFVTKTINTAFQFNNFGLASAMAVILLLIVVIVVSVQKVIFFRKDE